MIRMVTQKLSPDELQEIAEDLDGYIKVVIDIEKKILTAGGLKHVEGEQLLLKNGSKQENLWGGGIDLETMEIDFDSMINLRPAQNTSREVLAEDVRKQMGEIIHALIQ